MGPRLFFLLIGFGLTVIGFVYIISYLNLMTLGYNFIDYVQFICGQVECLFALLGILITLLSIYIPGGKNYELHI
ncbi:MAG: hypothetical protein KH135_00035 [Firmicutes bacterium]|nr:hypothetical protein [Bacillota bacterium]